MTRLLPVLLSAGLWACTTGMAPAQPSAPQAPASSQPSEACGAEKYQYLVGKPRTAIPHPPGGANWRIYSTKEIITMDYVFGRMDILWDADTGKVKNVHCG